MQLKASRQPTSPGISGRCCHLRVFSRNWFEGRVSESSLLFCATGQECVCGEQSNVPAMHHRAAVCMERPLSSCSVKPRQRCESLDQRWPNGPRLSQRQARNSHYWIFCLLGQCALTPMPKGSMSSKVSASRSEAFMTDDGPTQQSLEAA